MIKAISVPVFTHDYGLSFSSDSSNGGISSKFDSVYVEHPQGNFSFEEDKLPENLVKIVPSRAGSGYPPHAEPVAGKKPGHVGWMYGGAILDSSDGRWRDISKCPIHLHDRQESQELYEIMSH